MATLQLTQIYLEREQKKRLQARAKANGTKVAEEVRRAILGYDSARERSRVAFEGLGLAEEELELAQDRFRSGVASSIEVDNAQASLVTAQADRIAASADQQRARFELWQATGRIRELIDERETNP